MARLVYLPDVEADTWMMWTTSGQGSCLRDYRVAPRKEVRTFSTADIEAMLTRPDHFWEMAPHVSYKDDEFWQEQISFKNVESGLPPIDQVGEGDGRHKLLSLFTSQISPLLCEDRSEELRTTVARWIDGFKSVVERDQFNHFDNSFIQTFEIEHGFGWTSAILEQCRSCGSLSSIATGREDVDFSLFAVEVSLGLSSKNNPLQKGKRNSIQPDGLGMLRDRSLAVLEMKGPQDDHDLLTATLQAFCGALAVKAKFDWIAGLTQTSGNRRPALSETLPPESTHPINLFVMVVPKEGEVISATGEQRLEDAVRHLRAAVPLGKVAYFVIDRENFGSVERLPVSFVY